MNNNYSNNDISLTETSNCSFHCVRPKNRIYMLCEDLIDKIFEYTNPYKEHHQKMMFTLSWNQYWYKYLSSCFYSISMKPFHEYYFMKRREAEYEEEFSIEDDII